jgi:hypothetical protein
MSIRNPDVPRVEHLAYLTDYHVPSVDRTRDELTVLVTCLEETL